MTVTAMVIQLSTRGTVDSDNWFLRLSDKAVPRRYHPLDYGWTPLSQNPCQNAAIFPAHRSWIRIGFGPESQQVGNGSPAETPCLQLTDCNFTLRGVKSLAYDLVAPSGRVSGRVALLLRSAERQPVSRPRFVSGSTHSPPPTAPPRRGRSEGEGCRPGMRHAVHDPNSFSRRGPQSDGWSPERGARHEDGIKLNDDRGRRARALGRHVEE